MPLSCADCLEIWEPQPPEILEACSGLYRDRKRHSPHSATQYGHILWPKHVGAVNSTLCATIWKCSSVCAIIVVENVSSIANAMIYSSLLSLLTVITRSVASISSGVVLTPGGP
jgi:hypothetical protein